MRRVAETFDDYSISGRKVGVDFNNGSVVDITVECQDGAEETACLGREEARALADLLNTIVREMPT